MGYDEDTKRWDRVDAVADLAGTTGTADGTLADVGSSFNQGTLNNNFRDLSAKVNEILAALRKANVMEKD